MSRPFFNDSFRGALKSFFWALFLACCIFVPLMVYNRGYFLFLGDFNVQQIPFYRLAHEAVKSGNVFWNWHTDLGANFIGSYSFYLLFSPFFWLTLPFPTEFVPHLMAPLLILKTACAALTSYYYIKRFVNEAKWAVIGSVLYAFSGFMTFNIFFNHFHEVCVFFPLLLIALEELVENDRRGFFALMVALNCMVNYWFFIGEVVFTVIYVIIRIITGGWGCGFKKFLIIALESVIGVLLAAIFLIPSVMAIMDNPRTGTDSLINGIRMWIYGWEQRFPAIIQSFFFPPELPSRPSFFPEMGAKWASLSAWLPLFSTTGVIAFCCAKKNNFVKRMIITSMIMALVPVFNSAFVMFNSAYYARWFYMPILMMSVATASALEERSANRMSEGWRNGWLWTAGFIFAFTIAIACSPVVDKEGKLSFGLYQHNQNFWLIVLTAFVCLLLTAAIIFALKNNRFFTKILCVFLSFVTVSYSLAYICSGKYDRDYDNWFIDSAIDGKAKISLPDEGFVRSDMFEGMDNMLMFWGLPNIQAFHSIVPGSIMEFYPYVGVKRDVSSKPDFEFEALRALLSVKWLFIASNNGNQQPMSDFSYYDEQLGYCIYQNDNFIPMGFGYTDVIQNDRIDKLYDYEKSQHMLSALQLSPDAIIRNYDIVNELKKPNNNSLTESGMKKAIEARRALACDSFVTDNYGFTATCNLPQELLVFFSVPYDKGWSAFVNGEEVVIEKANTGFMAVRVPAGNAYIRFNYMTPGLFEGAAVSAAGIALLIIYLIIAKLTRRRRYTYDIAPMQFAEREIEFQKPDYEQPKFGGELQKQLESLDAIDAPQSPEQEDE